MGFVTKEKLFSKDFFITYGWLLGGCFVFALGAVLFAEPYGFAPGGTYGLSMVFHHLWGWETEIAALCMDVPLLLLGIYFLGGMDGGGALAHLLGQLLVGVHALDPLRLRL